MFACRSRFAPRLPCGKISALAFASPCPFPHLSEPLPAPSPNRPTAPFPCPRRPAESLTGIGEGPNPRQRDPSPKAGKKGIRSGHASEPNGRAKGNLPPGIMVCRDRREAGITVCRAHSILKFRSLRTEVIVRMNARVDTRMRRWRVRVSEQKSTQAQVALDCHSRISSFDGSSANSSGG